MNERLIIIVILDVISALAPISTAGAAQAKTPIKPAKLITIVMAENTSSGSETLTSRLNLKDVTT